jgi:hypothetical protein
MAIEVIELQNDSGTISENENQHSAKREFMVTGTFSHNEAFAAARLEADDTITLSGETLYLGKFSCDSEQADIWKCTADYISEEEKQAQEEKQQQQDYFVPKWDADTTGATHHITSSYKTTMFREFAGDGEVTTRYSNAINVRKTKTGFDVKGIDVIIPALELTATVLFPPGAVTVEVIKNMARATGKTNAVPWYGFEAGELLFKGVRMKGSTFKATETVFAFSASENIGPADNFKVGEIGPITKPGHDYLWVEYENIEGNDENGNPIIFPKARYAFVEQIYRKFGFNGLGIGG